jgi:hypothetical protein
VLNKYVVRGNKVFPQLCICTFILVPPAVMRGGQPPVPSALVAREALAIRRWDEAQDAFVTQRALPMRIPVADWAHIPARRGCATRPPHKHTRGGGHAPCPAEGGRKTARSP